MKLYILHQSQNSGPDTHDSILVCAESSDEALQMTPDHRGFSTISRDELGRVRYKGTWATSPEFVSCVCVGDNCPYEGPDILMSSFNAG